MTACTSFLAFFAGRTKAARSGAKQAEVSPMSKGVLQAVRAQQDDHCEFEDAHARPPPVAETGAK